MKKVNRLLAIFFLVILAGCQTKTNDSFAWYKLKSGMTKTEVISTLGQPDSVSLNEDKSEEILVYKRSQSTFSILTPISYRYEVVMRNDKLLRYSEQAGLF